MHELGCKESINATIKDRINKLIDKCEKLLEDFGMTGDDRMNTYLLVLSDSQNNRFLVR